MTAVLLAWSNHFDNGFHWRDFPVIVNNRAVRTLSSVPRFFLSPHAFSDRPELTEYRPLLSALFTLDTVLGTEPRAKIFQVDSFLWFLALLAALYGLFRLIPGGTHYSSALGVGLFALHPGVADTVNYISRRGVIIGALGTAAAFLVWFAWPRMLPELLWVDTRRNPRQWREEVLRKKAARVNRIYTRFIHLPLGLYLIPVALAMLADPSAAAFAPLLAAYMAIFEPERLFRRAVPAFLFCGTCFALEYAVISRFGAATRIPWLAWWRTEPWVAARYLCRFFVPFSFSPDSGLEPLSSAQWPLTLAGLGALAALALFATWLARRSRWRAVSFGIWWFLIALLPAALAPNGLAEDDSRMFLPFIGLALALTRSLWILFARRSRSVLLAGAVLTVLVLGTCGFVTYRRNRIWEAEDSLWLAAASKNPQNERALIRYADAMTDGGDTDRALDYLNRASALGVRNPEYETDLALAYDRLSTDTQAFRHFQLAIQYGPRYTRALSAYSRWLMLRLQAPEAFRLASKAVEIEPDDSLGWQTVMDFYSRGSDWSHLAQAARSALKADPLDSSAQNALLLAESALERRSQLEAEAKQSSEPDRYVRLSVLYFGNRRYEECEAAARKALSLNPDIPEAWANIAAADHAMGKDDDAISALRQLLRLRPDAVSAQANLDYLLSLKTGRK